MDHLHDMEAHGPFDARYLAFLETITQLRPRLHRYCSRMTGSVMDGEDVVQDALFEAYRKLDQYDGLRNTMDSQLSDDGLTGSYSGVEVPFCEVLWLPLSSLPAVSKGAHPGLSI